MKILILDCIQAYRQMIRRKIHIASNDKYRVFDVAAIIYFKVVN